MTFETLSKLTQATLINEPYITSFDGIVFEPEKVKMGDLFISRDSEKIKEALSRGAYAILSDEKIPVYDEEVAWLRCENIENALIGLLRYYLMQKKLEFVCFDAISLSLMQKIAHKEKLVFLTGGIESDFHKIMDAEPESIVLGSDELFIQKIYPSYIISQPGEMQKIIPFKTTLFQSSFYYNEQLYENIKIPELFLPRLEEILDFLENKTLSYDIGKCEYTSHFYPIFITRKLQIKPFGSTPTTLIVTQRADNLPQIITYMKQKSAWSKQICFLPKTVKKSKCNNLSILSYQKLSEISRLKEIEFNFAIINADLTEVVKTLKNLEKKEQLSLF
jgi:ferrochelatase